MADDKLPRIPSFAELGISEDEIEDLEREIEKELEEARAKEEGRDPRPVPEGGEKGAGGPAAANPARGKGAASRGKKGRGGRFGRRGRKREKGAAGEAGTMSGARAARSGAPRAKAGDPGMAAGGGPATGKRADGGGPGAKPAAEAQPETGPETTASPAQLPWNGSRGFVTLGLMILMAWFTSSFRSVPSPVPASAPDSVFSSGRAMSHLVRIASEAHPPGSPAHADVREYLLAQLRALGHEPTVQTATSGGESNTAATVRNILARIPGSQPGGRAVLVTAHYDSREIALGAADDGSGVVAILESLRALGTGPPLRNDLIVLITDAEELGLLGAEAFAAEHPWMDDVALVVGIEMRGGGGPSMMFQTGADNGWVIDAFRRANPHPAANSIAFEIYKRMPNDTDFTPFKEEGRQGLNFAGVARAHVYHQVYDSPQNLDEGTVQHHGSQVLAMLREFGNADLSEVNAPDKTYLSLPVVGLLTYGTIWIWVLGVAVVVLWGVALVVVKSRGGRISGFAAGFLASVVQLGGVAAVAHFLFAWRKGAHPEFGALQAGAFHSEGWYVLAIVGAAFVLATSSLALLRRWFATGELAVGALFLPVVLAAVVTVEYPMAAINIQWPVLAGCIGALAVAGVAVNARPGLPRWLCAVLAAVPVVAVLAPLTESVWLAMGLGLAPAVAALVGLVFLQIVPLLDTLREPNGWWAPVAGLVLAGIFLAVGMSTANPSSERPAPSTLVYLQDRETGSAYWGTDRTREEDDPGVAWAAAAVGPFDVDRTVEDATWVFNTGGVRYALAAAAPLDLPPPIVEVVTDSTVAGDLLRVAVTSAIGAEMMLFRSADDGTSVVALNGKTIPRRNSPWYMEHWGAPEGAVLLDFERDAGNGVVQFSIIEHHLRPGELLGNTIFARPGDLAPNVPMLSDRAMIRTMVSVDVGSGEVTLVSATEGEGEGDSGVGGGAAEPGDAAEASAAADSADLVVEDTTSVPDTASVHR